MKKFIIASAICIIIFASITFISSQLIYNVKKNGQALKDRVLSLDADIDVIDLNDITPFEWEKVYFFAPYVEKEMIYQAIGFKWRGIRHSVSEGTMQIVFVKDNKVVCYCSGYGTEERYYIHAELGYPPQPYIVFASEDKNAFEVIREPGCVYIEKI